jgi:hypothetical protein
MKKLFLIGTLALGTLLPMMASQIGCKGGYPPLTVMVVTATPTQTLVPTPAYPTCTSTSTPVLIDDMEDNNNGILTNQCRNGFWYNYNDGTGGVQKTGGVTGPFTMGSPGVSYDGTTTSLHCVEVSTTSGFTSYGAGFGFSFRNPQANYTAYGYHGIQFYAKNTSGSPTVAFAVTDNAVVNAVPAYSIGAHTINMTYTSSWTLYQISMAQLAAAPNSYGGPTVFDPSQIQQVQWSVGPGVASDVWLDNISFY